MRARGQRLGQVGLARLLGHVYACPSSCMQLGQAGTVGDTTAYRLLPAMHSLGLLRICAWEWRNIRGTRYSPVYGRPGQPDAPVPTHRPDGARLEGRIVVPKPSKLPSELLAFFHAYLAMQAPVTPLEIASETGQYEETVRRLAEALTAVRLCYVAGWRTRPQGGVPTPRYCWGYQKPNVKRPVSSREDINRRYRERAALRAPTGVLKNNSVFNFSA